MLVCKMKFVRILSKRLFVSIERSYTSENKIKNVCKSVDKDPFTSNTT
uniref:Uncharacterized protein n=1 Tax=Anguilla anguilla TaxID=7936 RepID=A0A0E9RC90_ANGAN